MVRALLEASFQISLAISRRVWSATTLLDGELLPLVSVSSRNDRPQVQVFSFTYELPVVGFGASIALRLILRTEPTAPSSARLSSTRVRSNKE
jgi:hypothetical protein